jgi:SAM-dependent methyltransferase
MDTQSYWNKQHDKYAQTDWIYKPSIFAEWVRSYMPASGTLLDLGAGQAQDSRYFAATGYTVTATDLSPHALELAQKKSPASIKFQIVDLSQSLPFADESYSIVYAHLSLHYFDTATTAQLFAEIHRVLKPGGMLAALFNSDQDPEIPEGKPIEQNFIEIDGIYKRYFNPPTARAFAKDFEIVVADNQGTTYKDAAKGINNLVRLVARKP